MENKIEQNDTDIQQSSSVPVKAEPKPAEPKKTVAAKPVATSSKGLIVVSLLLAVVAVSGSAYLWQTTTLQQQQLIQLQTDTAAAIQRVNQQATDTRELQRQLDRQQDAAKQQQAMYSQQVNLLRRQLADQQKRLLALSTTDRTDWLLAEADYLIRLANQRLLMGKEITGAYALLNAADDIVREIDDSALFAVREALADDIASLQASEKTDLEGIYLQLGALARQVEKLRLIELPQLTASTEQQDVAAPQQDWQQQFQTGLDASLNKLSQYIKINRRDEIYKPLLAPEFEAAVRQNVRLMFEQAQMASLAGKQQLYQDSLTKAKQWLSDYYTLDKTATAVITNNIDQLLQQQVEIAMPDISGSLRALKNYIDTIHKIKPRQNAQQPVEEPAA